MRRNNMIPIDGERLRQAIEDHGMYITVLSEEMGYNPAFLNNAISRGTIAPAAVKLLEHNGIRFSDYEPLQIEEDPVYPWDDPENPDAAIKPHVYTVRLDEEQVQMILNDLHNMIYRAIYEGVKKAWNE